MDINVRSKMGCVREKIGLTGQLDRRQLENYFKPCQYFSVLIIVNATFVFSKCY